MSNVYQSPGSDLSQSMDDYEYVGFWMRVVASILDNIWIMIVIGVLFGVFMLMGLVNMESLNNSVVGFSLQVALPFLLVIAFWVRYAATPGKMLFKARILDAKTLEPASTGRYVLRYIGYIVCVFTLFIGFIWVGIDSKKQGLHDKIAGTVVVKPK